MLAALQKKRKRPAYESPTTTASKYKALLLQRQKLPIWSAREKLLQAVRESPTLVVVGETGSGKTTQIPQLLYSSGIAGSGMVACTQPRRVAAVTVARRVAEEMNVKLGDLVGYSIRFEDVSSAATRIKYLTDGMLLREALLDPLLRKYKVVVVDEAHERTVQTDVLLGLLKAAQSRRKAGDLRLLVMSATLDAGSFVRYFPGAQAAYVQGRQHPVRVLYTREHVPNYHEAAITTTLQVHVDEPAGDILVFLTGQEEIEAAERLLTERAAALAPSTAPLQLMVVPIYAAMPPDQQLKVFEPAPEGFRKAILATNIAETSLTISGVRYVVDPGFVKARTFHAKAGLDSLQVVPVSQAQARQRSGRAGREAAGKCYRLYTEGAFLELPASSLPEIQRSNLATVVLQLKAMGIANVVDFDFMDPPPKPALLRSLELLFALGALDTRGQLTQDVGRSMAGMPVEPMYARALLASGVMGCSREALAVVAMVSTENIFFTPRDKEKKAAEAKHKFIRRDGDHLTLLAVYQMFCETPPKQQAAWCSDNFLNIRSLRKASDIWKQLEGHMLRLQLPLKSCGEDTDPLRRALVCGLFPNSAKLQPDGSTYKVISTGQAVKIHPSSVLCGKKVECVLFNELLHTSKCYIRECTAIEPRWLPELAPAFFAAKASAAAGPLNGAPALTSR